MLKVPLLKGDLGGSQSDSVSPSNSASAQIDAEREAAIALCAWLGHLPLAIELVGRYLAETGTIASVLAELKARSLDAVAIDEVPDEMSYERNVRSAIGLSWEPLEERERRVLLMVSVFAIGPIKLGWVVDCLPEMEGVEGVLDRVLVKRSLLEKREGRYQMHALVRAFVGGMRGDDGELGGGVAGVMVRIAKTIWPVVTLDEQARVRGAVPQMEEVAVRWTEGLEGIDKCWCCIGLARFYEGLSLWPEVERCYERSLAISKAQLGDRHPHTATSLNNLAELYRAMSRYEAAEPLYVEALAIRKAELGDRHPETATSLCNLAVFYHSTEQFDRALPLLEEALSIRQAVLPAEHPDILSTQESLVNLRQAIEQQNRAS